MFSYLRTLFTAIGITLLIFQTLQAATLTVTSRENSGTGTLREALSFAQDGDTINFSTGGNSITVYSQMSVSDSIMIDGGGSQVIGSNGTMAFSSLLFLNADAAGSTIQGLALIDAFRGLDIYNGANGVLVRNCALGTDWSDTDGVGNQQGVRVENSDRVTIGGIGQGNVISGNDDSGIRVVTATNLTIQSNYIGTNSTATAALSGQNEGISLISGSSITIGGNITTGEGNVISGNTVRGLSIGIGPGIADGVIIAGNIIGLNVSRSGGIPNQIGLVVWRYTDTIEIGQAVENYGNIIAGNQNDAILLDNCSGTTVLNNLIGLNDGNTDFPGGSTGIYLQSASNNVIGGRLFPAYFERNIIVNHTHGVRLAGTATGNTVSGNFIGLDATGNSAMANNYGIRIDSGNLNCIGGGSSTLPETRANIISGNSIDGILVYGGIHNAIIGNLIGLGSDGTAPVPNNTGIRFSSASDYTVGSAQLGEANIISGNTQDGIYMNDSTRIVLSGNLFGTNYDGHTQVPNGLRSLYMNNCDSNWVGGLVPGTGNLFTDDHYISGDSDNNTVVSNGYGVLLDGSPLPSPIGSAITLGSNSDSNFIGLPNGVGKNYIANASAGVVIMASALYNGVYGNTITGCSSPINPFPGANQDKSPPTVTSAFTNQISGTSVPGDYIEVFKSDKTAGFMGGSDGLLGFTTADGSGDWSVSVIGLIAGDIVTAIATDSANNSSQFAVNVATLAPPTATPSHTPSITMTSTITPTVTVTLTASPTASPTPTITMTATHSPVYTHTSTSTITPTITITNTPSPTVTNTPDNIIDFKNKKSMAYPNPGREQVTFAINSDAGATIHIHIYNLAGEQIASIESVLSADQRIVWDCQTIAPGIYMATIKKDGSNWEKIKISIID